MMVIDHGPVPPAAVARLVAAVGLIPADAWESRVDPESRDTKKLREVAPSFPREAVDAAIAACAPGVFGPGNWSRTVLSVIPAGTGIDPHTDDFGEVGQRSVHCHLPVISSPEAVMGGPEGEQHLMVGRLYSMDATQRHWCANRGTIDRVHLLFAYEPETRH